MPGPKPPVPVIQTFNVPLSASETIPIRISEPNLRADSLTLTTWTSAFVLTKNFYKLNISCVHSDASPLGQVKPATPQIGSSDARIIPVLELGAGTGLSGIAASLLWRCPVVLTDLSGIVPGLRHNILLNTDLITSHSGASLYAGTLDWRAPSTLTLDDSVSTKFTADDTKARIIIAADTVYDEEHPALLVNAISTWLARSADARVILTVALRVAYLEEIRELWTNMEQIGLECENSKQEIADVGEWNDDDERLCEWSVWRWRAEHL